MRERKIPKPGGSGKLRKLGIPNAADKVVQAALKLVLEPIFEAGFEPVSYGFRPVRRAHDAIAEIHQFGAFRVVLAVAEVVIQLAFQAPSMTILVSLPSSPPSPVSRRPARPGPLGKLAQQLLISRRQLRFGLAPVLCHVSHLVSPLSLELHR